MRMMAKTKKFSELTKGINKDPRRRALVDQHKEAINQALMLVELVKLVTQIYV